MSESYADRQMKRFGMGYIHPDEDIEGLRKWGHAPQSEEAFLETYAGNRSRNNVTIAHALKLEEDRKAFIVQHNEAVELYHGYTEKLQATGGAALSVAAVMAALRMEPMVLTHHRRLLHMSKGKMDWINSIFRKIALDAENNGPALLAAQRLHREARRQQDLAQMANMPNFGMF